MQNSNKRVNMTIRRIAVRCKLMGDDLYRRTFFWSTWMKDNRGLLWKTYIKKFVSIKQQVVAPNRNYFNKFCPNGKKLVPSMVDIFIVLSMYGRYEVIAQRAYGRWSVDIVLTRKNGANYFLTHKLCQKTGGMC